MARKGMWWKNIWWEAKTEQPCEDADKIFVDPDLRESVELCRLAGIPESEILHNLEEIDKYFTE